MVVFQATILQLFSLGWLFLLSSNSLATSSRSSSSLVSHLSPALARIPRGGGWFGNNQNNKKNKNNNSNSNNDPPKFPPLSEEEIEEKLNVPVFGITDLQGNGVTVRHKNNGKDDIVFLFFSQQMAEQARHSLEANNQDLELKTVALDLGKMWFRLLHNETAVMTLKKRTGKSIDHSRSIQKRVTFRLVADARNLLGARLLTTLKPEQAQRLTSAMQTGNKEEAQAIAAQASSQSQHFTQPYDEIPIFAMPHMRAQKRSEDDSSVVGDPVMPMFFGVKNMVQTFLHNAQKEPNFSMQTTEAKIQLIEIHELVKLMQSESNFDFRNIVLLPLVEDDPNKDNNFDDDSDSDDGPGGDFGIKASDQEPQIEMYTDFGSSFAQGYPELMSS